jgi:hypothetical protein
MEEWMGRRGGKNGRRGEMKEGEQGGKVEVDFISSLTIGKRFFRERLCGTALPLCIGDYSLRLVLTKGTLRGGEASRSCNGITDKPSLGLQAECMVAMPGLGLSWTL